LTNCREVGVTIQFYVDGRKIRATSFTSVVGLFRVADNVSKTWVASTFAFGLAQCNTGSTCVVSLIVLVEFNRMTGEKFTIVGGGGILFVFTNGEAILRCDKSGYQGAMDENGLVFIGYKSE
jgi:hypothetical protein